MSKSPIDASAAASTLFLGHSGEWWDSWLIVSLVLASVAALAVGVTTWGSIVSHKREATAAQQSLDKYKVATSRSIAEANEKTSKANQRAAEAEQKAAEAQLALEQFKAPRSLGSSKKVSMFIAEMAKFGGQNFSGLVAGSVPDARSLWTELVRALVSAKWNLLPPVGAVAGDPPAGIPILPDVGVTVAFPVGEEQTTGPRAIALSTALSAASIANRVIRNNSPQNRPGVIVIEIGTKP